LDQYCRDESTELENEEVSEKTSPQKSLEEEYLETEKKVPTEYQLLLTWFYT
jgi:hypothetical protein